MIGVFGAMDKPKPAVEIDSTIQSQLPSGAVVRDIARTQLAPAGEQVILYDSSSAEASVVTPKPAMCGHFKTGHVNPSRTVVVLPCRLTAMQA